MGHEQKSAKTFDSYLAGVFLTRVFLLKQPGTGTETKMETDDVIPCIR